MSIQNIISLDLTTWGEIPYMAELSIVIRAARPSALIVRNGVGRGAFALSMASQVPIK